MILGNNSGKALQEVRWNSCASPLL